MARQELQNCVWLTIALCLIFLAGLANSARALTPDRLLSQCRMDSWGSKDGLPIRQITSIAQTPDGFIWLGTAAGLFRFDGSRFDQFDTANVAGLTSSSITKLNVDPLGTLWIGTERGGFGSLRGGVFHHAGPVDPHWNIIRSIAFGKDGSAWAGGNGDTKLFRYNGSAIQPISNITDDVMGLESASDGSFLAALSNNGLMRIDAAGKVSADPAQALLPSRRLTCLLRARDGAIWCGTDHDGLCRLKDGQVTVYGEKNGIASDSIQTLYQSRDGKIRIGTTNGLTSFDGKIFRSFTRSNGLPDPDVRAITEDNEGNLWVGAGPDLIRFSDTKLIPYVITDGASVISIHGILPSRKGGMWCSTNSGLWRLHGNATNPYERNPNWTSADITRFCTADDGSIWAWQTDPDKISMWRVESAPGQALGTNVAGAVPDRILPRTLPNLGGDASVVAAITSDSELILGTESWYRINGGKVTERGAFPAKYIFNTQTDRNGNIWVSTSNGLFRFENGHPVKVAQGSPKSVIISADVSDPDDILFVTEEQIGRILHGKVRLYSQSQGLPKGHPLQIARDRVGGIWIGGDMGIYRISNEDLNHIDRGESKALKPETYTTADGIADYPDSHQMAAMSDDGSLWFPGENGLTRIGPVSITKNHTPPPVVIEDATIDQTALRPGVNTDVRPGDGSLRVRYAALSYVAPEKIQFRYKLEGFDKEWIDPGDVRQVTYNSLPPGHYSFHVAACNEDGIWNDMGAWASFDLQPHYYQTLWFRGVMALLGLIAVAAIFQVRAYRMVAQTRALERQVSKRAEDLRSAYNELHLVKDKLELQNEMLITTHAALETQNDEIIDAQEELANANSRLLELATTDGLTGLRNHRAFHERLVEEWQRRARNGAPLSLIMLDIDHFKQFNDSFGHPVGDEVLRGVAQVLMNNTRPMDTVARYGGEEMAIIAPNTDIDSAALLAERLRSAIENGSWPRRGVTASFGIATATLDTTSWPDLVSMADSALYASKHGGRNMVSLAERAQISGQRLG